jgi:hypothetical protein
VALTFVPALVAGLLLLTGLVCSSPALALVLKLPFIVFTTDIVVDCTREFCQEVRALC